MRGEIDFCESFTRRVALLKGLDESVMRDIAENLPITEGVDRMMTALKRTGYKTAILSGGFNISAITSNNVSDLTMSTPTNWRSKTANSPAGIWAI